MNDVKEAEIRALLESGDFDEQWYLEQYPDVKVLGMSAAEHYAWIGRRMGRRGSASDERVRPVFRFSGFSQHAALDVLFIDGANGTTSTTYRVNHVADGLLKVGMTVEVVRGDELPILARREITASRVVFFRCPFWSPYREFAERMRAQGSVIVYDVDDLVFDEDLMKCMDGNRFLSPLEVEQYRKGIRAYREFVEYSDLCTVSTHALAEEVRRLGKPAFVVRNTISEKNIIDFSQLPQRSAIRPIPFVIGYYSGTKTHQADFALVAPALLRMMKNHADVHFRLVGQFELGEFPEFREVESRIIRVGLMPHHSMLRDQLSCDVIIAPLEVGNPFCESKSELKFFEAALAKCPVIASPTRTFAEATRDGRFALLAATERDWFEAFEAMYGNYPSAVRRAAIAHDHVITEYSERVAAREWLSACHDSPHRQDTPDRGGARGAADVAVLITDVIIGGGGHRKVFKICQALERAGLSVTLYVLYSERPAELIRSEIRTHFYDLDARVVHFRGTLDQHRFAICTHWSTANELGKLRFSGKTYYFVQDFEPLFNSAGSDYVRALSTYRSGALIVCYGRWVAAKLRAEVGVHCVSIPFTLDHLTYSSPRRDTSRDIDVLFFARPSQERRCFSLIIEGLRELKARAPTLNVGLFGERSYGDVGFDYTNFGLITDPQELAALYRRTRVGVCFSTTNPSQLGYEMIACGAVLIDVAVKFHELNFDGDAFVKYCVGTPESLVEACIDLLRDEGELVRRRKLGCEFVATMPPDEELGIEFLEVSGLSLHGLRKGDAGSSALR